MAQQKTALEQAKSQWLTMRSILEGHVKTEHKIQWQEKVTSVGVQIAIEALLTAGTMGIASSLSKAMMASKGFTGCRAIAAMESGVTAARQAKFAEALGFTSRLTAQELVVGVAARVCSTMLVKYMTYSLGDRSYDLKRLFVTIGIPVFGIPGPETQALVLKETGKASIGSIQGVLTISNVVVKNSLDLLELVESGGAVEEPSVSLPESVANWMNQIPGRFKDHGYSAEIDESAESIMEGLYDWALSQEQYVAQLARQNFRQEGSHTSLSMRVLHPYLSEESEQFRENFAADAARTELWRAATLAIVDVIRARDQLKAEARLQATNQQAMAFSQSFA